MASAAAKAVAKEVLETIGKGKKPSVTKIAVRKGYKPSTAKSGQIQKTKSYQAELSPLVSRLEEERDAIVEALKKKRKGAKYRDLIDGLDKITKNLQLLTGGSTANIAIGVKKMNDSELERLAQGDGDGNG